MLPLGDFSLLRDIPKMYQNYTKVTSAEEAGVIDFIGDYLMHGKDLFGHNGHDKTPVKGDEIQFQHSARPLNIVFQHLTITFQISPAALLTHPIYAPVFYTGDFRNKLFRPPLA
ncbi:hypothetical protein [Mucilaginibacter sp.]|uniref:hypothetical protein n=1 Tax=Mucilaginibacter sp. TaxID=1882438 RepID=UPI002ED2BC23